MLMCDSPLRNKEGFCISGLSASYIRHPMTYRDKLLKPVMNDLQEGTS